MEAETSIELSVVLLLLVNFPLYRCVEVLTKRLILNPYPRHAWGSWLCVVWTIALIATVLQFPLGTVVHLKRLEESFVTFCLPTLAYALVLAALVSRLLPKPPDPVPRAFLLTEFQRNKRFVYLCVFLLSVIPFAIASSAFGDQLHSPTQIMRLAWMGCAVLGLLVPPGRLLVHKGIILVAGPLTWIFLATYALRYGS